MNIAVSRMQFLRGDFRGKEAPLRPPWSIDEVRFIDTCDACSACIQHCPTHIISSGRAGYPVVDFKQGECIFCGDCARACHTGAINRMTERPAWTITASIDSKNCLAYRNVECRSCYDPCEVRSITMMPRIGGVNIPQINTDCTGCGACVSVCPVSAISITDNNRRMNP